MFSLDTKQWENVAEGLLSSVTKTDSTQPETVATDKESESDNVVDFVAVKSDER